MRKNSQPKHKNSHLPVANPVVFAYNTPRVKSQIFLTRQANGMKKLTAFIGIGVLCVGFGILVACFLPPAVLVCIEAVLLILAGFLAMKCR